MLKGRKYNRDVREFDSVILYGMLINVQGRSISERWARVFWLGDRFGSEEHVAATEHLEEERDRDLFNALRRPPRNPEGRPEAGTHVTEAQLRDIPSNTSLCETRDETKDAMLSAPCVSLTFLRLCYRAVDTAIMCLRLPITPSVLLVLLDAWHHAAWFGVSVTFWPTLSVLCIAMLVRIFRPVVFCWRPTGSLIRDDSVGSVVHLASLTVNLQKDTEHGP